MIFFGGQAVAGAELSDSLDGIIVGFFLFTLSSIAYQELAWNLTREAQLGTLERLYMSPHGFGSVIVVKTVVNLVLSFFWGAIILLVMMLMTGRWLTIDPLTVIPLVVPTLASVVGIGFLIGGVALIFKRIENVFQIIQFAFIGLIAAPAGSVEWLKLLPLAHGSYLTRRAMTGGVQLWEFPVADLALLVGTTTFYLLVGFYCFHRATQRARREGLLGHY